MTPSRGTAPGVAGRVLTAAWRELAESGGPACVLHLGDGVLEVAWVNAALCRILRADAAELAGRPLRDLVLPRPDDVPQQRLPEGSTGPDDRDGRYGLYALDGTDGLDGMDGTDGTDGLDGLDGTDGTDGLDGVPPDSLGSLPPGWATAAHRLARGTGGTALALLEREDGTALRVQVRVNPVSGPDQVRGALPRAQAGVHDPGVVDPLPAPEVATCWLVTLDPLGEALDDLQAALTTAEHRFTALARCAPIGIFVSDVGLRLGYVNDRFVGLTGLEGHALLGTGWLDAVHRDDLQSVYAAAQTVLGGTPVELTVRLGGPRDRQCWLQLRLAPMTTPGRAAGFIGTAEDVTQRRSWEEHLTYQARHDPLTGLVNRRRLIEVLADLLSGRRGKDREFAVLFLDLDGFKDVNDTYGHEAGDRALIEVARRMQKVVRETDVLARVSGDEFVVVLRQVASEAEATAAARRHLAALSSPVRIGRAEVALTASVGVAMPSGFDTPESLLRAADRVMYEAKAAGQGLYRLAPVAGEGR